MGLEALIRHPETVVIVGFFVSAILFAINTGLKEGGQAIDQELSKIHK